MADPVASVERIVKIGLKIKEAVKTVRQNEKVCQEIRKRVLRFSDILSELQHTGIMRNSSAMSGALEDLEETLEQALELVTACQERNTVRRLIAAGDLSKQLRGVKDDISNKVMLATFAINAHTTIILLTIQGGVHLVPRQPQDTGVLEVSPNIHSTDEASGRSELDSEENGVLGRSEAPFVSLAATLRQFRFSDLKAATKGFSDSNIIGQGGVATVYVGVLDDRNMIAIKKFRWPPPMGWAHTYNQLLLASKLQHKNIVEVLGYARGDRSSMEGTKGKKRKEREYIWVEEYVPNGTLHKIIYCQEPQLDWSSLVRIIKGIAQGLNYLHEQHIVHLDLKPTNILLDSHMNPKITDFEVSKVLDDDEMNNNIIIAGTFQYLAPEYVADGIVSTKNDVYAFGITLLETVSSIRICKQATEHPLHRWACRALEDGRMEEFDPALFEESQLVEIKRCVEVGLLCAQPDRANRPTMEDVIQMLDGVKELTTPARIGTSKVRRRGCLI